MNVRRAPVVWKKDENGRVLIMAKTGVFMLNKKASELWEALNGGEEPLGQGDFIQTLLKEGLVLVEAVDG